MNSQKLCLLIAAPFLAAFAAGAAELSRTDPDLAVAWNKVVNEISLQEVQFPPFTAVRAHAMMHIAIHDTLNAVIPLYRQYAFQGRDAGAHPLAAAAQAAHDVVLAQYPGQQAKLTAELAAWLTQIPETPVKLRGIALGHRVAAAIIALRMVDGWDFPGTYSFVPGPGQYQTTPPFAGFVLQPGFRFARPFGIQFPAQFRPAPPPALNTSAYAAAYNEVKDLGRFNSSVRTLDQSRLAIWWMEFAENSVNRLARELATERRTHLWQAARMFAVLNMNLFDTYVGVWDSKFEYNHWRPWTAIREADSDGNPATAPDPAWEPLTTTPPFPEYISAHAAGCSASFEALKRAFGDNVTFTMRTATAPPDMPSRSFPNFTAAAAECAQSRVFLGWHFRYSTNAGLDLGRAVATWISEHHLQGLPDHASR
jgi:hypothetical protein